MKKNSPASKKGNNQNKPRTVKHLQLREFNKHINFDRESEKGSARKWPTKVCCCKCKKVFILPFKPRRPDVYCDECFKTSKKF